MPNVISKSLIRKYLEELAVDESAITEAAEAYEAAKSAIDVRLRRYIALRDYVTEKLGQSPYSEGVEWPEPYEAYDAYGERIERGRFRFSGMSVGDAILEVLEEEAIASPDDPWLPLQSIIERLSLGGLGFPEPVQGRAVNAALLKTSGITRSQDRSGATVYAALHELEVEEDLPNE